MKTPGPPKSICSKKPAERESECGLSGKSTSRTIVLTTPLSWTGGRSINCGPSVLAVESMTEPSSSPMKFSLRRLARQTK